MADKRRFLLSSSGESFSYTAVRNHALNELEHSKVAHEYEQKIIAKKADAFFRDAIVEEESTSSSARTVNEPGNPVNFLTYDEEGELVESESVEEAVEEAKTDVPAMASRAAETSEKAGNLIVVIDPGHGGYDPGAVGVNGAKEKDLTLKIAKYCKEELEKYSGVTVYMTRTTDTGLSPSNNLSDDLKKRIKLIALYKDKIELHNLDAVELIHNLQSNLPNNSLFYFDPPYYKKGKGSLYELL